MHIRISVCNSNILGGLLFVLLMRRDAGARCPPQELCTFPLDLGATAVESTLRDAAAFDGGRSRVRLTRYVLFGMACALLDAPDFSTAFDQSACTWDMLS